MKQNSVTHVLNLSSTTVANIFDPNAVRDKYVIDKLALLPPGINKNLGWPVKYKNYHDLSEYKIDNLHVTEYMREMFEFIEDATLNYSSCLLVSTKNKCCTVAVAIVYMLFKYNWSVSRTLEIINARKIEIELTKRIVKQLRHLENQHEQMIKENNHKVRRNWQLDK
jgi:hypothetical protein